MPWGMPLALLLRWALGMADPFRFHPCPPGPYNGTVGTLFPLAADDPPGRVYALVEEEAVLGPLPTLADPDAVPKMLLRPSKDSEVIELIGASGDTQSWLRKEVVSEQCGLVVGLNCPTLGSALRFATSDQGHILAMPGQLLFLKPSGVRRKVCDEKGDTRMTIREAWRASEEEALGALFRDFGPTSHFCQPWRSPITADLVFVNDDTLGDLLPLALGLLIETKQHDYAGLSLVGLDLVSALLPMLFG